MPKKAPINETGTAKQGIKVARQFCKKTKTTKNTKIMASIRVFTTSRMDTLTKRVVS